MIRAKQPMGAGLGITIYVSPQGNDRWSGRLPEPNRGKTEGPLATIEKAQRETRRFLKQTKCLKTVRVVLRGGRYELKQPLVFNAQDSGMPMESHCHRVIEPEHPVYCAYEGEIPVISGGRQIGGWTVQKLAGKTVWVAELQEVRRGKWYFRQLWVNGERRFRPRLPRKGHFRIAEMLDANYTGDFMTTTQKGSNRFVYTEGDLKP